jgi:hypothetical protein
MEKVVFLFSLNFRWPCLFLDRNNCERSANLTLSQISHWYDSWSSLWAIYEGTTSYHPCYFRIVHHKLPGYFSAPPYGIPHPRTSASSGRMSAASQGLFFKLWDDWIDSGGEDLGKKRYRFPCCSCPIYMIFTWYLNVFLSQNFLDVWNGVPRCLMPPRSGWYQCVDGRVLARGGVAMAITSLGEDHIPTTSCYFLLDKVPIVASFF